MAVIESSMAVILDVDASWSMAVIEFVNLACGAWNLWMPSRSMAVIEFVDGGDRVRQSRPLNREVVRALEPSSPVSVLKMRIG